MGGEWGGIGGGIRGEESLGESMCLVEKEEEEEEDFKRGVHAGRGEWNVVPHQTVVPLLLIAAGSSRQQTMEQSKSRRPGSSCPTPPPHAPLISPTTPVALASRPSLPP